MSVSIQDLEIAVNWLRYNEGGGGEDIACAKVADMLAGQLSDRLAKKICRQHGVTLAQAKLIMGKVQ